MRLVSAPYRPAFHDKLLNGEIDQHQGRKRVVSSRAESFGRGCEIPCRLPASTRFPAELVSEPGIVVEGMFRPHSKSPGIAGETSASE
jgi:hypothetical protein